MQLRTARFGRLLGYPAQCNSFTHSLPVYLPTAAGHSYATIRRITKKGDESLEKRKSKLFTLADVPPATDLDVMFRHPAVPAYLKGMTGEQARDLIAEYTRRSRALRIKKLGLAVEHGQRGNARAHEPTTWQEMLREMARYDRANEPAVRATLHSLACVLLFAPTGRPWLIALHILHMLGADGRYAPSDLTLARLAHAGGRLNHPQFADVLQRVTTGRLHLEADADLANYQALRGLICATSAPTDKAARDALWWFQQALDPQKGRRTPGAFDWQAMAMVEMGQCYERVGEPENAAKIWELAATELDSPHATGMFAAAAMDKMDPRAEEWLTRAAMGGYRAAQTGLAAVQKARWEDAESKGVKGWELEFRKVMKDEWEALATGMP